MANGLDDGRVCVQGLRAGVLGLDEERKPPQVLLEHQVDALPRHPPSVGLAVVQYALPGTSSRSGLPVEETVWNASLAAVAGLKA
eukprot:CAMPEP_0181302948 /NCGR_PEP_ID=MMETSP1101-20121128/8278_1 /TAXON_ID=46948 /ORGANISM="Rhodomonas abbreviata, Strain Caron Lab Isolate" /LENGTH=84 /DNA_ID=CAMNT_0023408451 /DNA_START=912 /DNA_END=1166 /DNA_ORIENTATION=-